MAKIVLGITLAALTAALTENPDVIIGELNEILAENAKLAAENEKR